jgi:hypothetical protein
MFKKFFKWIQLRLFFKMKNSLPESPTQEISTSSSQSDVVLQSLEVKGKQEQVKFFEKKNDLRDVVFDLNPVWDNHQVYGEETGEDDGWKPAEIKAIKGAEEKFKDDISNIPGLMPSPWDDLERFPRKNYFPKQQELDQLKLTENDTKTHDKSEDNKNS